MKRTTIGRFWGYTSVFIALGVSLAGNVTAASLHGRDPDWVDLGFAGIPPLAAFLSIEIVNHNPWKDTTWGPRVRNVLLGLVAPASAVVSFIHLVSVVVADRETGANPEGVITWITAVLTALLIDGLMFGGTAALLLPAQGPARATPPVAAIEAYPNWREEIRLALATTAAPPVVVVEPPKPVKAVAPRTPKAPVVAAPGRQRYAPREHPLWTAWLDAASQSAPWSPEQMVEQMKTVMGRNISTAAAATMIGRWTAVLDKDLSKV